MQLGTPEAPLCGWRSIGSGPSGFYAAEHLQDQDAPGRSRSTCTTACRRPSGWCAAGVAPDHQKIKSVTRVYDKIAAHPEFRFYGNVEMGRDLTHADLVGLLPRDRLRGGRAHRPAHGDPARAPARQPLGHRVRRAGTTPTRTYRSLGFDLSTERAVVVGNGNVAMDLARILASSARCWRATDIADHALDELAGKP